MIRVFLSTVVLAAMLTAPTAAQANFVSFSNLETVGCGPTLAGTWEPISQGNGVRINLTITTEQESAVVLLFVSGEAIVPGIPIDYVFGQNYGCELNVIPWFSQAHQSAAYSYTFSKSLGNWWGTAYVQFAEVYLGTTLEVKTTNVLALTRPHS